MSLTYKHLIAKFNDYMKVPQRLLFKSEIVYMHVRFSQVKLTCSLEILLQPHELVKLPTLVILSIFKVSLN